MKERKLYSGHPRFYKILEELAELHSRKNKQYATQSNPLANFKRTADLASKLIKSEIKNKPLVMALMYMAKQVDGVYEIVGESKTNTPDSLKDKLMDIAIYSIIAIILSEEE